MSVHWGSYIFGSKGLVWIPKWDILKLATKVESFEFQKFTILSLPKGPQEPLVPSFYPIILEKKSFQKALAPFRNDSRKINGVK